MHYKHLEIARQDSLAILSICREKALNALSSAVMNELCQALSALENTPEVRVVALTGAGTKAFAAGADIAEMKNMSSRQALAFAELGTRLGQLIASSSRPYIAAVNGFALGGGCELALACDFIYAGQQAKFGQPEVKLGVIPGFGGTQRLARRVGVAKAKELCFSGEIIDAEEALRIGLVDRVVAPQELMASITSIAQRIAQNAPLAVAAVKQTIDAGVGMPLGQAMLLEKMAFATLFDTSDQREGMAAFLNKRAAHFTNE